MPGRARNRITAGEEARRRVAAVRDDPLGRLELARDVYPTVRRANEDRYSTAALAFMEWEIERGVLAPVRGNKPGSAWWRNVNEELLRDSLEARLIFEADGPNRSRRAAVQRWLGFFEGPNADRWYRAHNASVATGYVRCTELAARECAREQILMQHTLARVLYAHALVSDEPLTGLRRIDRIAAWLVDPRRSGIGEVMDIPEFYPRHYPLGPEPESDDDSGLLGFLKNIPEAVADFADDLVMRALSRLFSWSSVELGVPELSGFVEGDRVLYPQLRRIV